MSDAVDTTKDTAGDDALVKDLEDVPTEEEVSTPEEPAAETPDVEAPVAPAAAQPAAPVVQQPAAPAEIPEAEEQPPVVPKTPQQIGAERTQQDLQFWEDAEKGRVHPKTMADMFHEKGTLGKMGTLFGLMLAGAGSGLAHQPNALLEMMNKELDRDLDAQKHSKENAMNYFRLQQAHDINQAQIAKVQADTMYQTLVAAGIPAEVALKTAQAANLQAEAALAPIKGQHMKAEMGLTGQQTTALGAKNKMLIQSVNYFQDILNKMPDGPQKENGLNFINTTFKPAVLNEVQSNNERAGAATVLGEAASGANAKPKEKPPVDLGRMNAMVQLGKQFPEHPMAMSPGEASEANKEAATVTDNRVIAKMYDDSFKKLDQAALGGKLNKQFRDAELSTLGAEIARATAGRYNQAEAASQANGMFPAATDWGGARKEKYRKAMDYFKGQEAATPTLDRFKLKSPFPEYQFGGEKAKKETRATAEKRAVNAEGEEMVFRDGKWSKDSSKAPKEAATKGAELGKPKF